MMTRTKIYTVTLCPPEGFFSDEWVQRRVTHHIKIYISVQNTKFLKKAIKQGLRKVSFQSYHVFNTFY